MQGASVADLCLHLFEPRGSHLYVEWTDDAVSITTYCERHETKYRPLWYESYVYNVRGAVACSLLLTMAKLILSRSP